MNLGSILRLLLAVVMLNVAGGIFCWNVSQHLEIARYRPLILADIERDRIRGGQRMGMVTEDDFHTAIVVPMRKVYFLYVVSVLLVLGCGWLLYFRKPLPLQIDPPTE
jgi:hypothetical protein